MAIPTRVQLALRSALTILLLALFFLWIWKVSPSTLPKSVKYSELLDMVRAGQVTEVELHENEVVAKLKGANDVGGATVVTDRIPRMDESELLHLLDDQHVAIVARSERGGVWSTVAWALLPFLLLPGIFWLLAGAATRRGQPLSFGRSKAKIYDSSLQNQVTFADVAGVDEARAELMEIVAFLQDPTRYTAVGARVPKGVLLVGAPGTGKTLLARAVAGESRVPFFSISGSEFVEMFVGVGAARVRDLFEQAKERAPCIIFIDELDAVGKKRAGAMGFAANEEREQTLNQLLVEMDGFEGGMGLVIMAATNRPEILDKALLRAGRFDRQVVVDRPDVRGREAILKVHARKVRLGVDADLGVVARRTPGMVGADLANVVNEAALASVRRGADKVEAADFDEAVDRIQLGLKREGRVMTEEEKRRVAFHEAGHVLVALSMKHADPVYRVTIIPRGVGALGMTLQLPTEERFLVTREELYDRLTVLMGGRAGELIACGDFSTGAQDDLERATEMARQMVCRFGMSESLGPVSLSMHGSLGGTAWLADGLETTPVSDATAHRIDGEIKGILAKAYDRARGELERRGALLARLAKELIARETLQREELNSLVAEEQRETPLPSSGVVSHPGAVPKAEEELPQFV